ncbi:ATP-binding protein [Georgenia sunbinii]|uniref:ATP-binding protein n=1 Tax=Georgenia sunbinii TaxID=3117728 RepID=UPI002F26BD1C
MSAATEPGATVPAPPARLPLRRPSAGRRVGGVCTGLAAHLDLPLTWLRWGFVLTVPALGAGVLLYLWLWLLVPAGDPALAAADDRPVAAARLAPRLRKVTSEVSLTDLVVALLLLMAAITLVLWRAGVTVPSPWLMPVLVVLAGAALVWSQLDANLGGRSSTMRWVALSRVAGGLLLATLGMVLLLGRGDGAGQLVSSLVAAAAILIGAAVVLAPLWLRLVRDLGQERAARAREAERADIAAHLHDSVLQTLSLIRSRADDAEAVARLARAQERELREWLYEDRPAAGTSTAAAIRQVAAEVEDQHGIAVDVVTAGDHPPDASTEALSSATREALRNAVVHGRPPVSLYVEVGGGEVTVFVRDRGAGFDPEEVPEHRHGVRESIIGRLRRHGGRATIRSGPAAGIEGTEVVLAMPTTTTEERP